MKFQTRSLAKEIKPALINREWIPIDGKNVLISARLNVRKHTVEIDIKYGDGIIKNNLSLFKKHVV